MALPRSRESTAPEPVAARNDPSRLRTDEGVREFLDELAKRYSAVCVTDHMRCGYATRLARAAAARDDITVLPGMETNCLVAPHYADAIHVLAVFPPDVGEVAVERIAGKGLGEPADRTGLRPCGSTISVSCASESKKWAASSYWPTSRTRGVATARGTAQFVACDADARGPLGPAQTRRDARLPAGGGQRAQRNRGFGPEVVKMPAQIVAERGALGDQSFAVIDEQADLEFGSGELRGGQRVEAFTQRGAGDRDGVDGI